MIKVSPHYLQTSFHAIANQLPVISGMRKVLLNFELFVKKSIKTYNLSSSIIPTMI